jgi:hypothetical protein
MLDEGKELGMPDGVLINGKGPYRYNDSLVPAGIEHETIDVHPGNPLRFSLLVLLAFSAGHMASGGAGRTSCIAFIQSSALSLDKNLVSRANQSRREQRGAGKRKYDQSCQTFWQDVFLG